jgi:2-amino-4-hydroxy-6-hydroxymethyldihydropteridine diphosphokinase
MNPDGRKETEQVFLGLGSNVGDRLASLESALVKIAELPDCRLLRTSGFYETRPIGGPSGQANYLNAVCQIRARFSPPELLAATQRVERELGRRREEEPERWGPRRIDIDILLWGESVLDRPELVIPHPRLAERAFVLAPLAELAPDAMHPTTGLRMRELLERMAGPHEIIRRLSF